MTDFTTPTLALNDGREMPQLGFGTFRMDEGQANRAVGTALEAGYELIDTAALYKNEAGVGRALAHRDDIWLTTKIWNDRQGYAETLKACDEALERIGRDSVDLLLIHWPCPDQDKFVDSWRAFAELREAGKAKSLGVANFRVQDLEKLADASSIVPAVNQVELHPSFQQRDLRKVHDEMGIVTQSWAPLGVGKSLEHTSITRIAEAHGVAPATVVIAWHMAHGLAPIPKSASLEHMRENFAAIELELTEEDIAAIDELDSKTGRMGPDPADLN